MRHLKSAYRSGLEVTIAAAIAAAGLPVVYEQHVIPYTVPTSKHRYTPDYVLPNGIIIETKGIFDVDDRRKMELVREQHPDLDIRMVFSNANAKIRKGSKTTYAIWCQCKGIPYSHKIIDPSWLTEPIDPHKVAAVAQLRKA